MFGELKVLIKKRIIVRRTVRSMFGEKKNRPVKNELNRHLTTPLLGTFVAEARALAIDVVWIVWCCSLSSTRWATLSTKSLQRHCSSHSSLLKSCGRCVSVAGFFVSIHSSVPLLLFCFCLAHHVGHLFRNIHPSLQYSSHSRIHTSLHDFSPLTCTSRTMPLPLGYSVHSFCF